MVEGGGGLTFYEQNKMKSMRCAKLSWNWLNGSGVKVSDDGIKNLTRAFCIGDVKLEPNQDRPYAMQS